MRRFLFGVVIASMTAAMPSWAMAGDREIANVIMTELQNAKSKGALKGFDLDLKVESGVVYLSGNVRSTAQHDLVLAAVENAAGVTRLVDELKVVEESSKNDSSKNGSEPFSLAKAIKQSIANPFAVVPASTDAAAVQPAAVQVPAVPPASADSLITDTIIGKLQELKQAGLTAQFARTIGVRVDHRRRNKSAETLQRNVKELEFYKSKLTLYPLKANKPKKARLMTLRVK